MLTYKFEEIKMSDDETFGEFFAKLNDIISSSFNIGENILNKIVMKIMKSLLESFRLKLIIIEEIKDLNSMKVEYFIESIQTYELFSSQPKKKILALKSSTKKVVDSSGEDSIDSN